MMNVKTVPAIVILAVISFLLFVAFADSQEDGRSGKIYADPEASWMFEGTFCSKCNQLYNYIEHPKVCSKCGEQTKDYYYLVLIKER